MLEGSIMSMECPDCGAIYLLFGDFLNNEGRFVRAAETPTQECDKCAEIAEKVGFE